MCAANAIAKKSSEVTVTELQQLEAEIGYQRPIAELNANAEKIRKLASFQDAFVLDRANDRFVRLPNNVSLFR